MEPRFGQDFSRVRVHSGDVPERSARDVNAHAYTVGPHIVFAAGRYSPSTLAGQRLLAHELTHVVQQRESTLSFRTVAPPGYDGLVSIGTALQRDVDGRATADKQLQSGQASEPELPVYAYGTPQEALPGDRVPGYEVEKPVYTIADHEKMLRVLILRGEANADVLTDFYNDLREAWIDLVIAVGVGDAGFSFASETVFTILGSIASAFLPPLWSFTVSAVAGTFANVLSAVAAEKDLDWRKEILNRMKEVSAHDAGAKNAKGLLEGLVRSTALYANWLGSHLDNLEDLGKFRIPPLIPKIPMETIRFQIAAAVLRTHRVYPSHLLKKFEDPRHTGHLGKGILYVQIFQGEEHKLYWDLDAPPELVKSIVGHRIEELNGARHEPISLVVSFNGRLMSGNYTKSRTPEYDDPPLVVFGLNTFGTRVNFKGNVNFRSKLFYSGNIEGYYQLSRYCLPEDPPLSAEETQQFRYDRSIPVANVKSRAIEHAECGASLLYERYTGPYVLKSEDQVDL